jgi:hypothetical protein
LHDDRRPAISTSGRPRGVLAGIRVSVPEILWFLTVYGTIAGFWMTDRL